MDKTIRFIFEHKKDKDQCTEEWTIDELIYGVGKTLQPVKDLIRAYREDGYIIIDTITH
jgi:hypothetical protein